MANMSVSKTDDASSSLATRAKEILNTRKGAQWNRINNNGEN
jgi:hypothetical protein